MLGINKVLIALALFGTLPSAAFAQNVDVNGPTAGDTAKTERGMNAGGKHMKAGNTAATARRDERASIRMPRDRVTRIVPKSTPHGTTSMAPLNGRESGVASANIQNPTAQAVHSAEATAHKTVHDPNNQLGTSLQGRTRPVAGSGSGSHKDTAPTDTSPVTGAH